MTHDIETPFGPPGFLMLSGSRLYGIDTPESDYDYVGVIVEPASHRVGLDNYSQGSNHQHGFEQHEFKGDGYEGSVYSLWKFARMCAEGNPTVLCLLFGEPIVDNLGIGTQAFRDLVLSKKSGHRFMKYMEAQRRSMTGERTSHTKRPTLKELHGYDTKFASHLIRLGYQGVEFLETGRVTLPMLDHERQHVLGVRRGLYSMDEVVHDSVRLQTRMEEALTKCTLLPDEPNHAGLSRWVADKYLEEWELIISPY